jgi:hypothetical protein
MDVAIEIRCQPFQEGKILLREAAALAQEGQGMGLAWRLSVLLDAERLEAFLHGLLEH